MSQYGGYGNPYYDNQTPYYGYGQPEYVTGHAEGSGSSFHNIEDFQPRHGYPGIYPEYQSPYDINLDDDHRKFLVPENEYQVPTTTFPYGSYNIKDKERQFHDFGQRDDLFDLVSRKTSMSRRTSIAGSTTDKMKISPTTYETATKGRSIKLRTEHEELMRYIPQQLQRLIEKIDNPPKDRDCGYNSELKKDKKMYEMIEERNIDEDIRNTQAIKSAGKAYGSIPAPPIDGWWLRKCFSRNKNLWLQSLENDMKLFQKLMPSASGGAVVNLG
ncbi:hypothetical protein BY996DRAFT_6458610 [Phakopsora pachyrhizi]|nr:hypothetical protein BY996DRAFT_6458610 [Phakopsora pachyrhizi]